MSFHAKEFAGSHCGCRYQQDYRPTLGRTAKRNPVRWRSSSSTTMVPSALSSTATARRRPLCSACGRPAWMTTAPCTGCCPDRRKSYYDEDYLPKKLDRVDEAGNLYFDGSPFPWKLADDFAEDKRWGYPKWKVLLGKLTGKGQKCD